jgi:hypothetical protein
MRALLGILKVPKDFDWHQEYRKHTGKKYSP